MSSEMVPGKCLALAAVRHYFKASATVAKMLAVMFQSVFPEEYENYRQAFQAGVWYQEDPGPWIARAIVYKLHVNLHHYGQRRWTNCLLPCREVGGGLPGVVSVGGKVEVSMSAFPIFLF